MYSMKAMEILHRRFNRTRFLAHTILSSPMIVFTYSPLLVTATIAEIAVPFATGHFIDALINGAAPIRPFAVLAALLLTKAILTPCLQRLILSRARNIELTLQKQALNAVMDFSPAELFPLANGELVAKLTRDAYAIGRFVSELYPRLLVAVITIFAAGSALFSRSAALGISFMAFIPLAVAIFLPFSRRFSAASHSVRKRSDDAFATLFEFFHSLPFLRTLGAEHRFADSPCYALTVLKDGTCVLDRLTVLFSALIGAILVGGEIVILGAAGTLAAKGAIPVGDVVVYQLLFLAAMQSVQGIVSLLPETASLCEGIDSLDEIFARPTPRRHICKDVGTVKNVEFRNVTYSYPGAEDRPVVKNFSATFHAGRIYALVGANGAGKTTLLKLATGALVRQSGEILVNGTTMKAVDEDAFRRETGIVFQDSLLLSGSVRDNITLRDPMFTDVDVMRIIRQIGLENMVKRLPDGLNTRLGLRGQLLSGGELQRLAIARALVRNPSVLVLDEATNHLDAAARASFAKRLRDLASGRIVLIVSHDDEIINLCDEKIFCQISESTSYIRA